MLLTIVVVKIKKIKKPQGGEAVFGDYIFNLNLFTLHNLCNNLIQGLRLGQAERIICQLVMQRVILGRDFPKNGGL